jgi:oligoribonuclease (3'-5' exoribonuclease)
MTPLIFVDCETTGLQPDRHVPWEIAWVTAIHDAGWLRIESSFQTFRQLSSEELFAASPEACAIGRYDERYDAKSARNDVQIATALAIDCSTVSTHAARGCHPMLPQVGGGCPGFDHAMLCQNVLGWPAFGEGLWHYHLIDVETLAAGRLGWAPPYSSDALIEAFKIVVPDDAKHTAMGDVQWSIDLYAAAYNLRIERP